MRGMGWLKKATFFCDIIYELSQNICVPMYFKNGIFHMHVCADKFTLVQNFSCT